MFFLLFLYFNANLAIDPTEEMCTHGFEGFICMMDLLNTNDLPVVYSDQILSRFTFPNKCCNLSSYNDHLSYIEVLNGNDSNDKYGIYEFWNPTIFHKLSSIYIDALALSIWDSRSCDKMGAILILHNKISNVQTHMVLELYLTQESMIKVIKLRFKNKNDRDISLDTSALFNIK